MGGTEEELRESVFGRSALGNLKEMKAHYDVALEAGHEVVLLNHEVFGGWGSGPVEMLWRLSEYRSDRLDAERHDASWTESSFCSYYGNRISVAIHCGVAKMILAAIQSDRKIAGEGGGLLGGAPARRGEWGV